MTFSVARLIEVDGASRADEITVFLVRLFPRLLRRGRQLLLRRRLLRLSVAISVASLAVGLFRSRHRLVVLRCTIRHRRILRSFLKIVLRSVFFL